MTPCRSRLARRSARQMASSEVWLRSTGVDMLLVRRGSSLLLEGRLLDGLRPRSRPSVEAVDVVAMEKQLALKSSWDGEPS